MYSTTYNAEPWQIVKLKKLFVQSRKEHYCPNLAFTYPNEFNYYLATLSQGTRLLIKDPFFQRINSVSRKHVCDVMSEQFVKYAAHGCM